MRSARAWSYATPTVITLVTTLSSLYEVYICDYILFRQISFSHCQLTTDVDRYPFNYSMLLIDILRSLSAFELKYKQLLTVTAQMLKRKADMLRDTNTC